MAAGNSPAMMEKNVGQGSQYLWTYRDRRWPVPRRRQNVSPARPPKIPANNFWSVVVYDALSRSELQNGQPLPSVSSYANPQMNADGSVDIVFGPEAPKEKGNWIRTVPGRGWFPIFRFYGPAEPFFDKTWMLEDIVRCVVAYGRRPGELEEMTRVRTGCGTALMLSVAILVTPSNTVRALELMGRPRPSRQS